MPPRISFVTGVVGAGKTSLIEPLRTQLGSGYEIHDFDERGVPDDVDMDWAADERRHWRDLCSAHGATIIDTSELTPAQTAERVCDWTDPRRGVAL
jgi:hypothetical protein